MEIIRQLKVLAEQVAGCTKCSLYEGRIQTVFARGNPGAKIICVAEAPGQIEDEQGFPLVGLSGQLLDSTVKELGYDTNEIFYIANVLKCRPPNNRKPTDQEANHCIGYLEQQLELIKPKIIIALGNTAISALLPFDGGITKIHGKLFKRGLAYVIPVYHPSFVLRNGSTGQVFQDFKNDLEVAINKARELI